MVTQTMPRTLRLFGKPTVDASNLRLTYHCYTYSPEAAAFESGRGLNAIHFDRGQLVIDNQRVLKPYFGHDMVSWNQRTAGQFTSGHLWFSDNGVGLHGVVYRGPDPQHVTENHVLATAIPPVNYTTQITAKRYPKGTDPDSLPANAWGDGVILSIGFVQNPGDSVPATQVLLDNQDISSFVVWSVDSTNQKTVLSISLDPSACTFDGSLYLECEIEFDIYQPLPTFSGAVASICTDQNGTGSYLWKGAATATVEHNLRTVDATVPALSEADLLPDDGYLSLPELMSIVPDDKVSQAAQSLLVENMKWAMGQDSTQRGWLQMILGENPPVLSPSQQAVAQRSVSWYQGTFAKAYLSWAITNYSGQNAPSTTLGDDQKLQLKYFLQTGMANDADFNIQQDGIYTEAFIEAQPKLQSYINDVGSNWAQQLYDTITSPPQFTLMVNRVWGAAGQLGSMTLANNFATLLSTLQPSGQLAQQYIQSVVTGTLLNFVHQSAPTDSDVVMEWLPDFLQEFLNQVATQGNVPDSAKIAAEQLHEMLAAVGGDMATVAQELSDFLVNANGANLLEKTQNAETAFALKFPKFAAVGQMLFFSAWCMGVIMVVKAFQNWKDLTPEDKAKAITTAVALGFQALEVVPQFIKGTYQMGLNGWNKFQTWRNGAPPQEEMLELNELDESGEHWLSNGATETTALFDTSSGTIKATGTMWESLFGMGSKVLAVAGIAVSAAFAVFSTIDFVNDIKSGQPITKDIFDGIMMATNTAVTICLVLDLFVATTIFAMAAAVLAIVGVVIVIIEMFVVKPKNPLESFMTDVVVPFVKGLPEQTPAPGSDSLQFAFATV